MLTTPDSMVEGWLAEYKAGAYQPTSRVTVQRMTVTMLQYELEIMNSTTLEGNGTFASIPFGQSSTPVEMKNLKSVNWSRNLSQFGASGSVVLTNTKQLPVGVLADQGEFDLPGYYTYQRGVSDTAHTRWGHSETEYTGLVVPDRLIHIYQGYGTDPNSPAEADPFLVKTFTGLIDSVVLNTDRSLTINFRDLGRALMDTIYWPDVVPWSQWFQPFETRQKVPGPDVASSHTSGSWIRPKYQTDSNKPYVGRGFRDGSRAYVDHDGGINGHIGKHAFDSSKKSSWWSVGNYARWSSAYEYVQGTFTHGKVTRVKVTAFGGPYTMYISLKRSGTWYGSSKIPYKARVVDTDADIRYVKKVTIKKDETKIVSLPKAYDADTLRITMADLWDSNVGNYQYRAGISDVQVFKSTTVDTVTNPLVTVGNIEDYTGVLAWILAWGGFFWPEDSKGFSYIKQSDGSKINYTHDSDTIYYDEDSRYIEFQNGNWYYPPTGELKAYVDSVGGHAKGGPVIPHGRIWGDLQMTGTYPLNDVPLKFEQFDKQPLSDCINMIKGIIGFNFFIDETGGAIWRMPNIYKQGNYISGATGGSHESYTTDYITIDEDTTLMGLATTVASANVRERVFVGSITGKFAATTEGFQPDGVNPNLRRYGGWTNTHFETLEEVTIMADLIALRQFMTYRQSSITIAANPAIQIDDQVKIFEKVTSDTYFHYVNGIDSSHDIASGKWTYTLNTSWLGEDPANKWVVDKNKLDPITQTYLDNLDKVSKDG